MAVLLAGMLMVGQLVPAAWDTAPGDTVTETAEAVDEPEVVPAALTPYQYLYATYPSLARRMDCVITRESKWDTWAVNRRSGAAGLAQFLASTWSRTPFGHLSRHDPYANIDGAAWLATYGGWQHWQVVNVGLC